jgi:hypothetical protein
VASFMVKAAWWHLTEHLRLGINPSFLPSGHVIISNLPRSVMGVQGPAALRRGGEGGGGESEWTALGPLSAVGAGRSEVALVCREQTQHASPMLPPQPREGGGDFWLFRSALR